MADPDSNVVRRQFATILRNSAQSYMASAHVTLRYAEMMESGTVTLRDIEDLQKRYPDLATTLPSAVGTGNKKSKNANGDMEIIMFNPPGQGNGDNKKRKRSAKKPKDPNAPKRPLNAYFMFQSAVKEGTKAAHPEMKQQELQQEISRMWGEMSVEDKKPYQDSTELAKIYYEKSKREYEAGLAAAAVEGVLGEESEDGGSPQAALLKKKQSSTSLVNASTSKAAETKKVFTAPTAPATSLEDETSGDEIDATSEEEEVKPPKKKLNSRHSLSPSKAKADKENQKVRE